MKHSFIHPKTTTCHLQVGSWLQNPKPYSAKYLPAQAEAIKVINLSSQAKSIDTISQ